MPRIITAIIVVAFLVFIGWLIGTNRLSSLTKTTSSPTPAATTNISVSTTPLPTASSQTLTINLNAQNNSGESGTAVLTPVGKSVNVVLNLTNTPDNPQPAHIHIGSCPNPAGVKYPLSPVANGVSETTVDVSMSALLSQLPLAINVHKSDTQQGVYVACGDIKLPGSSASPTASASATVSPNSR